MQQSRQLNYIVWLVSLAVMNTGWANHHGGVGHSGINLNFNCRVIPSVLCTLTVLGCRTGSALLTTAKGGKDSYASTGPGWTLYVPCDSLQKSGVHIIFQGALSSASGSSGRHRKGSLFPRWQLQDATAFQLSALLPLEPYRADGPSSSELAAVSALPFPCSSSIERISWPRPRHVSSPRVCHGPSKIAIK